MHRLSNPPSAYLVFAGGGVRTFSYVGALSQLSNDWGIHWWTSCQGFIGISGGAIFALLLTIGYTIEELQELLFHFPFKRLFQPQINHILNHWSFDNCEALQQFYCSVLNYKKLSDTITFQELYQKTGYFLHIIVSNITKSIIEDWNYQTQPNMTILNALRATCAIPLIFPPIVYQQNYYMDGAFFEPFPIYLLSSEEQTNSIGFYNYEDTEKSNPDTFVSFTKLCFHSMRHFLIKRYITHPFWIHSTIHINMNIELTNFDLTMEQRKQMFEHGKHGAECFYKKQLCLHSFRKWKHSLSR